MKVLLLIDIAAFKNDRLLILDRCLLTATRLISCALLLEDPSTIRWGYRIINSQYEPESFATAYKNVAVYGDEGDAAGSALQKGGRRYADRNKLKNLVSKQEKARLHGGHVN